VLLTRIRGVGRYGAVRDRVGGGVSRFLNAHKLRAPRGLTPTIRSSDGQGRLGHSSRQGSRILARTRLATIVDGAARVADFGGSRGA
jgi:transposase